MNDDRAVLSGSDLIRWIVVAVLIVAGVALFFYFAPSTRPVVPPSVEESAQ